MAPYTTYYATHPDDMYLVNGWYFPSLLPEYVEFWEQADGSLTWEVFTIGLGGQGNEKQPINACPGDATFAGFPLTPNGGVTTYNMWNEPGYAIFSPFFVYQPVSGGLSGWNNSTIPGIIQVLLPSYLAAE